MKLYYFEALNPRKACAAARYLSAPVEFVLVDPRYGQLKSPEFLAINPNGQAPVLVDGDETIWESNAIMCHLADRAGSEFWPHDGRQIDIVRWLSWDASHFSRHGGALYFEHIIKPMFGLGEPDAVLAAEATGSFRRYARVLNDHLAGRACLVGDSLTVADFAVAAALPYADGARIPLREFAEVERWHARLTSFRPGATRFRKRRRQSRRLQSKSGRSRPDLTAFASRVMKRWSTRHEPDQQACKRHV